MHSWLISLIDFIGWLQGLGGLTKFSVSLISGIDKVRQYLYCPWIQYNNFSLLSHGRSHMPLHASTTSSCQRTHVSKSWETRCLLPSDMAVKDLSSHDRLTCATYTCVCYTVSVHLLPWHARFLPQMLSLTIYRWLAIPYTWKVSSVFHSWSAACVIKVVEI